jgi:hypothetical protein
MRDEGDCHESVAYVVPIQFRPVGFREGSKKKLLPTFS